MIHGYHVIWGTYGFWLPNDPRGSWSDFVYSWELARFGESTKSINRVDIDAQEYALWRREARQALMYPPVTLSVEQLLGVASGFQRFIVKSNLAVWSCSILAEHVHFVIGRHRYKMEYAANLLKGEATRRLVEVGLHPMEHYRNNEGRLPSMWGEKQWIVYLDTEESIENAIGYVNDNPAREGMEPQHWPFIVPFTGLPEGGWVTYY